MQTKTFKRGEKLVDIDEYANELFFVSKPEFEGSFMEILL